MRRTRTRRPSKTASRRAGPRKTAILIQTEDRPHTIFAWLRAQRSKLHFGKRHGGHAR